MKKMYRITLTKDANFLCDKIALEAAKSNGGNYVSLEALKNIYEYEGRKAPATASTSTPELIGSNLLHIDDKVGDEYKTVCIIEEVAILELDNVVEEITPSNGYGAMAE